MGQANADREPASGLLASGECEARSRPGLGHGRPHAFKRPARLDGSDGRRDHEPVSHQGGPRRPDHCDQRHRRDGFDWGHRHNRPDGIDGLNGDDRAAADRLERVDRSDRANRLHGVNRRNRPNGLNRSNRVERIHGHNGTDRLNGADRIDRFDGREWFGGSGWCWGELEFGV